MIIQKTIHTLCPNKGATKLMAVASSNVNQFQNSFIIGKSRKFSVKPVYYVPSNLFVAALPLGI